MSAGNEEVHKPYLIDCAMKKTTQQMKTKQVDQGATLDTLTDEIQAIHKAIINLRSTLINDNTLYLLIQHAVGANEGTRYKQIPLKTIKAVIEGIEALPAKCLKKGTK